MDETERTLQEMLKCPVCRDIFQDPRQLACGHSMCQSCLDSLIDHSSDIPFRCPDCRRTFGQVLHVQKSYALANIAEDFRMTRRRKEEEKKSVYCDCCLLTKTLAIKTCLKCEVSLCEEHLKDHLELPVFTGHPLVQPLGDLMERRCPQHEDAVLRYYCTASRRYICNLCAVEDKQRSLLNETSEVLRRKLTDHVDKRFDMVKKRMTESYECVKKLQEDIEYEKQKRNHPDSLLNSVTVLLLCLWFVVLYYAYSYSVENQTLTVALEKQQSNLHQMYTTMAGFLSLDLDTVSPFLRVSADLQTAERVKSRIDYPPSEARFDEAPQILSSWCFSTGTHVWEVEVEGYWDVAVSYKSVKRKNGSVFGNNAQSWSLTHNGKGKLFAYYNKKKTVVSETLQGSRIAVMVDFEEGIIRFSAVEPTVTTLHEFNTKLTQPVCLGLGLYRVDPPSRASIVKVS
ncbi:uncharacterized protein V6R79_013022 [Siganus canaliculatus]